MVKECPIIMNNEAVTVVKYGETTIQFPSIGKDAKSILVKCDNGMYSITDKLENEPVAVHKKRATSKKTIENIIEEKESDNE